MFPDASAAPDSSGSDAPDPPPGDARWPQPDGSVAITFLADDTANSTYADGQIQWTGSFVWDKETNTITPTTSWLPDEREWPKLFDDGPNSQGGHEAEGQVAGDGIHSTEVFFTATEETTFEFGALNEFNNWIWIGPNGVITLEAGQTGRVDAGSVTFPPFGDRDIKVTLDLAQLHADYATISADTHAMFLKGTMNSWTPVQLLDNGKKGDDTADDGIFTYLHSTKLGPHDGPAFVGQHVQFVFVFALADSPAEDGLEYKSPPDTTLTEGVKAWSGKDGELVEETIILEPDSYGKVKNTTIVISGSDEPPPPDCSDDKPCGDGLVCKAGVCVPEGEPGPVSLSLVDPAKGGVGGGTPVTVSGSGFQDDAKVLFGSAEATDVKVLGVGTITCLTPAGAVGKVTVTVQNPDGGAAPYLGGFEYTAGDAPTVQAVAPDSGVTDGGTPVTLTGTGFVGGATVLFGVKPAENVSVKGATTITCTSPATDKVGSVDVTVTNPDGQNGSKIGGFQYEAGLPNWGILEPPLALAATLGASPGTAKGRAYHPGKTEGDGGGLFAELGWGPDGSEPGPDWTWTPATWTAQGGDTGNDDVFQAPLPSNLAAGTYDYAFRFSLDEEGWIYADSDGTQNGYSPANAGGLQVQAAPEGMAVVSAAPLLGPLAGGTVVTIKGQEFAADAQVSFGGTKAATTFKDANTLEAVSPPATEGMVTITVASGGKTADAPMGFGYGLVATPTVDGTIGGDWPDGYVLADDTATTPTWDNNELHQLRVAFDGEYLYLGISGIVEPANVLVAYLDVDHGSGTGAVPSALKDDDGALDNALSGPALVVSAGGFGAEFGWGAKGGAGVSAGGDLSPDAGLRALADPLNFGWLASDVVWGSAAVELRASLATLGLTPIPGGRTIAVFVRIVNPDGEYASPEGLPTSAAGNGSVDKVVTLWLP